jgi:chloramphenicol-sensitive protein RarD
MSIRDRPQADAERRRGLLLAFGAYGWWGVFPLYLKALRAVPAAEILGHRVLWGQVFLLLLLAWTRRLPELATAARSPRTLRYLGLSTLLIGVNWLAYIWAVVSGRVLESSLGYYINPLVNVLLGVAVLRERLDRPARVAVGLATLGVGWMTWSTGSLPWLALLLAGSFGLYGLLRKQAPVGALTGLTIETTLLLPAVAGWFVWTARRGELRFLHGDARLDLLLLLAGPVTAVPLLFFAGAARRLPLSVLGFVQYMSPSVQFVLAVTVFGETLGTARLVGFALIWSALLLYAVSRHTVAAHAGSPSS